MPPKDLPGKDPPPDDGGDDREDRLLAALRAAREREPWTVDAVRKVASDPTETKATAPVCAGCDAPCVENEICATVVVRQFDLLEEVGRDRAFHLVESGMKRLRTRDEAQLREEGDHRPRIFVAISEND